MASTTFTHLSLSPSSTVNDGKASRQSAAASSQCVTLATLPPKPVQCQIRASRTTAYSRKLARNVVTMAAGEAPSPVAEATEATTELPEIVATGEASTPASEATGETSDPSEIVKTIQEAWDKVEDKYAVTSLAVAVLVALWGSTGVINAIDRLPLVPSVLELVGIGYTGWFAYKKLVFKPEREALIEKVKDTYKEIIGTR